MQRLKILGFSFLRQAAGSHEIWYNQSTGRYTTIPNHTGDVPQGTLRAILKQAGISAEDFNAGIGGHDAASCPPIPGVYPKELLALGIRDYREIFFKPYHVIYRVAGDVVHVLLITDGRRDMQTLLQRRLLAAD